jgi:LAO/AO transport system kinase
VSSLAPEAVDRRALARALSRAANASVAEALDLAAHAAPGHARLAGITGAPGAGKSTLLARLAKHRLARAARLAIIAIDPSSPATHGSVLGDRIRMEALADDPRVFIRSLPSRRAQDGLGENVAEILATLESFGFDEVLVETVGVGQSAYGVRALVDAEVLLLTPGAGDYIQAMKAGIMETADIFVVNKADLGGAQRLEAELLGVLQHRAVTPPVIRIALDDESGVIALSEALDRHLAVAGARRDPRASARLRQRFRVHALAQRRLQETLDTCPQEWWDRPLREVYAEVMLRVCASCENRIR